MLENLQNIADNLGKAQVELKNSDLKSAIKQYQEDVAEKMDGDIDAAELRSLTATGSNMNLNTMFSYIL